MKPNKKIFYSCRDYDFLLTKEYYIALDIGHLSNCKQIIMQNLLLLLLYLRR